MMGLFCVFVSVPRKINSGWFSITDISPPVITGPDFWVNGVIGRGEVVFFRLAANQHQSNNDLAHCFLGHLSIDIEIQYQYQRDHLVRGPKT